MKLTFEKIDLESLVSIIASFEKEMPSNDYANDHAIIMITSKNIKVVVDYRDAKERVICVCKDGQLLKIFVDDGEELHFTLDDVKMLIEKIW